MAQLKGFTSRSWALGLSLGHKASKGAHVKHNGILAPSSAFSTILSYQGNSILSFSLGL